MRVVRSPIWVRSIFPSALWSLQNEQKTIFLSFDDGPTSRTTEILQLLQNHGAKATFFCVGANVEALPNIYAEIVNAGHRVGNHSYSHCKGWKVSKRKYLMDVEKAQKWIQSDLYRPPYGKMTWQQYSALKKKFRIVMWSHLSYDFDPNMPVTTFLNRLKKDFKGGEIVVLHDNLKYFDRSIQMLKEILIWTRENDIACIAIPD